MATVTELLEQWRHGKLDAFNEAVEFLYQELKNAAAGCLARSPSASMQPTVLVHEVYLRLASRMPIPLQDRKHFLALAAKIMRQVLVDGARRSSAQKRGGDAPLLSLDEEKIAQAGGLKPGAFLVLDQALNRLSVLYPEWVEVIEMRYFGGLDLDETAEALDVSAATVTRRQRVAEAWLNRELSAPPGSQR